MRLTLVAHAETVRSRELLFGDTSVLVPDPRVHGWRATRLECFSGPEPACRQTAVLLHLGPPTVLADLAGPDFGGWAGQALTDVHDSDPAGLSAWMGDPDAAPHDGESLTALSRRVGRTLDEEAWPAAGAVVVVTPLVARAALAHTLGAPASAMLRAEVAPLGHVTISRNAGTWRLLSLVRQ